MRACESIAGADAIFIGQPQPPVLFNDMVVIPIHVDTRFKGKVSDAVLMSPPGPFLLDPASRYLFFTSFMLPMGDARLVRPAGLPLPAGDEAAAVRVVRAATTAARGIVILGSIEVESPGDPGSLVSPVAGLAVRIEAPGFVLDTMTDSQGAFMVTDVPSGTITIKPTLHERFTIVNGSLSRPVEAGGCVPFTLRLAPKATPRRGLDFARVW